MLLFWTSSIVFLEKKKIYEIDILISVDLTGIYEKGGHHLTQKPVKKIKKKISMQLFNKKTTLAIKNNGKDWIVVRTGGPTNLLA